MIEAVAAVERMREALCDVTCSECGALLPECGFSRRRRQCRACGRRCQRKYNRKWREANRERERERVRKWQRAKGYSRKWYEANQERAKGYSRKWYEANQERAKEYSRKWREANRERDRERDRERKRKWREANQERDRERCRKWREANPHKARAGNSRRRARERDAEPPWLTREHVEEMVRMYAEAARTGTQVDHIVPLSGKHVCGLHVPWNLQLMTPEENMSKGNYHESEERWVTT